MSIVVRHKFGKKIAAGFTANGYALKNRAEAFAKEIVVPLLSQYASS